MSEDGVDLFGNPVLFAKPRGRGRPQHVPTIENHNRILLLAATGRSEEECAAAIGVSPPTLRKHYFSAVQSFDRAKLVLQGERLSLLAAEGAKGNVAAIKELGKEIERGELRALGERVKDRGKSEQLTKAKGLKEQRKEAAQGVKGLFEPRKPPSSLAH
ncbi:hypothetical protein FHR22_002610 [Sphingopyxis panaciterrae]|uniref:hypothetical protein n=1 Tax=Sphingopyxis panaciterrae TaxID=363841 RepID=UPI00141F0B2E|nr:hypothetical protein [Sphingopyxis panaciterrae]NIJ37907.1 hypothetical protein [Sphingopyxis panaciterrae]